MKKFKHLSYEERVAISFLHAEGWSTRKIGAKLNRHHACIAYELKKKVKGMYVAKKAHHKSYWRRYLSKKQCMKVALDSELSKFIPEKLREGWSPERISGYLKLHGKNVSTKAVYKFVYSRCLERYLFWRKHHKKSGWKKKRYGKATDGRKYIEERPETESSGHWEGDFIVSSHNTCSLLVLVDRYSRDTIIRKISNRKHAVVMRAFQDSLRHMPVRTLTLDNDISFNCWKKMERIVKCQIFFCHPFHSWEKGLVENTNRWIRTFVPKKKNLREVTDLELRSIEKFLNEIPRQCLGFKTAKEVLLETTSV
jgi:transposase, IS30 family